MKKEKQCTPCEAKRLARLRKAQEENDKKNGANNSANNDSNNK